MKHSSTFWNKIARKYANSAISDQDAYEHTLKLTQGYLRKSYNVLEVGCGTASTALIHAPFVRQYTATDYSAEMVAIGQEKVDAQNVKNLTLKVADITEINSSDGQYDVILALNVLHLLENQKQALAHIHSLLKPGGLFISKTICHADQGFNLKFALMMRVLPIMQFFGKAPYVGITSIAELDRRVTDEGFEIIEVGNYPASPASRFIVARKP